MNIFNKTLILSCIPILLGLQQVYAATYYVSPSGLDTNNGTATSTPLKTINAALNKAVTGDTVYAMTGTYVEMVKLAKDGITLSAAPNSTPVIDGQTTLPNVSNAALITVTGNNNTISGFEVKNSNIKGTVSGGYGVQLIGHHNKLNQMNIHDSWQYGVLANGDYSTVENSVIWQNSKIASSGTSSVWKAGIEAGANKSSAALKAGVTSYPTFRNNKVFNNWGDGINCSQVDHCTAENNTVYDNWFANLYLADATNTLYQGNLIYVSSNPTVPSRNNARIGISMADENSTAPRSANNVIINNFIYNAKIDAFTWTSVSNSGLNNALIAHNTIVGNLQIGSGGSPAVVNTNSQIRNNIILGKSNSVASSTGITFSNNNWASTPTAGKSSTDIVGDPKLAKTGSTSAGALTADYFKLQTGSPVIDKAVALSSVTTDFFNATRTSSPDIGGHEFGASTSSTGTTTGTTTDSTTGTTTDTTTDSTTGTTTGTTTDSTTGTTTGTTTDSTTGTTTGTTTDSTTGLISTTGKTYYVSPTGINTNNGTSISTPLKTIKTALSKAVTGDVIYLLTGTYVETVSLSKDGISLVAYPNNTPVIDGQRSLPSSSWGALISISGKNNLVSGIEVKNSNVTGAVSGGYGIQITGTNNKVSKVNVHHTWEAGVLINGDYNTVEDSTVWQASVAYTNTTITSGWGTGLSAARNASSSALIKGITSYPTLRRNVVYNNWGEGISCFEADHCIMEDNISYDNWTVNLYLSDATNSVVQRNLIYISSNPAIPTRNNTKVGILLSDEVSTAPRSKNNTLINNLIYNASFAAFSWSGVSNSGLNNVLIANNTVVNGNFSTGSSSSSVVNSNSQIRNNIFLGANNTVPSNTGLTFSNNNWGNIPAAAKSSTDVVADPQLAKTGATTAGGLTPAYFKLLTSSPLINKGATLSNVKEDYFKTPRVNIPDIGGHEAQ